MIESLIHRIRRLTPSGSIKERAVKSGFWATLLNVSDRALILVMTVVLANILAPSDFGLLGIALLGLGVMKQLSQLGLDESLIQHKDENVDAYLNTLWTMKVLRGLIILAVAYIAAPYIAEFFGEPRAGPVLQVIALSPLLLSLQNPRILYLDKDLQFHKKFGYRLSGTIARVVVAIGLAVLLESVWALVFGLLVGQITRTAVSYVIDRRSPIPEFKWEYASEMFGYGKWITGLGLLGFLFKQSDDAFVGWFLSASALGFYQLSYQFARAPSTEVTHVISSVLFPTYSKIQDDIDVLRRAYFRALKLILTVSAPMVVGIILVAPIFVYTFLGAEWENAIRPMQILALWGFLNSIGAASSPLFRARGRPDYMTKVAAMQTAALFILIYPLTDMYGITGTAIAVLCSGLFTSEPIINYLAVREVNGSFRTFTWIIAVPLCASLIMSGGLFGIKQVFQVQPTPLHFTLFVATGAVIYVASMVLFDKLFDYGTVDLFRSLINSMG